jgi:drug/metabolite transporter (DMT)-like permease
VNQGSLRSGYGFAAATVMIWSGFVLMARLGGRSQLTAWDLTALRFGVAALVLLPAWLFWKRVPLFTGTMAGLAATGGLGYSLTVYAGFKYAPAAHGAVLISGLLPFFVPLCAWLIVRESPRHSIRLALPVIALGLGALAVDAFGHSSGTLLGDLLMVSSSLLWAIYTILVRRSGLDPWQTTIGVALLAALVYLPVYVFCLPHALAATPWPVLIGQGFYHGILVVIIAMLLYMQALTRLGAARLGSVMAVVPAVGGVGASLVLGEPLSPWLITGLALTSAGAWLGAR